MSQIATSLANKPQGSSPSNLEKESEEQEEEIVLEQQQEVLEVAETYAEKEESCVENLK